MNKFFFQHNYMHSGKKKLTMLTLAYKNITSNYSYHLWSLTSLICIHLDNVMYLSIIANELLL